MKKISLIVIALSLCIILASCGSTYNEKHISLYDSHTKQYIHLGDTREQIISILGEPDVQSSSTISYENYGLLVGFKNNAADQFMLSGNPNDTSLSERLKVADVLTIHSSVDDFMKVYPDAVDGYDIPQKNPVSYKTIQFIKNKSSITLASPEEYSDSYANVWFESSENHNEIVIIR